LDVTGQKAIDTLARENGNVRSGTIAETVTKLLHPGLFAVQVYNILSPVHLGDFSGFEFE